MLNVGQLAVSELKMFQNFHAFELLWDLHDFKMTEDQFLKELKLDEIQ